MCIPAHTDASPQLPDHGRHSCSLLAREPGTTCLARQPRVALQGCHKHLSCSLKKKKKVLRHEGTKSGGNHHQSSPAHSCSPQQFQKTEKSDTPHSPLEAGFGVLYRKHSHMYVGVLIVSMAKLQNVRP